MTSVKIKMFLKSIHLQNFKKFKELDLEFPGDLTVVKGPNEQGKSTVTQALIAGLFYDPKKDNEAIRELKSWQSDELCTITMRFEEQGSEWELKKDFQNREMSFTNKDTEKKFTAYKEISEALYRMGGYRSINLFHSTACVRQGSLHEIASGKKEIEAALQDLVTSGEDDVNVVKIIQKLEKEIGFLEKGLNRKGVANPGPIKAKQDLLESKREEYKKVSQQVKDLKTHSEQLEKAKAAMGTAVKDLSLKQKELEYIGQYFSSRDKIAAWKKNAERLEKDIAALEKLDREEKEFKKVSQQPPSNKDTSAFADKKLIFITAGIFGVIGLLGFVIHVAFLIGFLAAGGLLTWKFLSSKKSAPSVETKEDKFTQLKESNDKSRENILQGKTPENLQKEYREVIHQIRIEEDRIYPAYLTNPPLPKDQQKLEREIANLSQEKDELYKERVSLESSITHERDCQEKLLLLEEDAEDLKNQLDYKTNKLEVYTIARQALREVKDATITSLKDTLKNYINTYIFEITHSRYRQVELDDDLRIKVYSNEKNEYVEVDKHLSRGTIDQFYLVSRFAMLETLSSHKKPLVLLDDPFVNFDNTRRAHTKHICQKLAEKFQIILFTHSDEYDDWGKVVEIGNLAILT